MGRPIGFGVSYLVVPQECSRRNVSKRLPFAVLRSSEMTSGRASTEMLNAMLAYTRFVEVAGHLGIEPAAARAAHGAARTSIGPATPLAMDTEAFEGAAAKSLGSGNWQTLAARLRLLLEGEHWEWYSILVRLGQPEVAASLGFEAGTTARLLGFARAVPVPDDWPMDPTDEVDKKIRSWFQPDGPGPTLIQAVKEHRIREFFARVESLDNPRLLGEVSRWASNEAARLGRPSRSLHIPAPG
jgi:hypothetical protein